MSADPYVPTDQQLAERITVAAIDALPFRNTARPDLISYELDEEYEEVRDAVAAVIAEYRREKELAR